MKKSILLIFLIIIISAAYWSVFINDNNKQITDYKNDIKENYSDVEYCDGDLESGWEIYKAYSMDGSINYIVYTVTKGYRSDIYLASVFNEAKEIIDLEVIKQKETKNKGSLIVEDEFLSQFLGKDYNWDGTFDAISGATISSDSAANGISSSIRVLSEFLENNKKLTQTFS